MANLVYLASGGYKSQYEDLPFDKVYLVDPLCHGKRTHKVHALKMDALESHKFFKDNGIQIDCLVLLRESQGEGGDTYNMCSDMLIGYFMSILPESFVLISNDISYYQFKQSSVRKISYYNSPRYKLRKGESPNLVSFDLPYRMTLLSPGDTGYMDPTTFSNLLSGGPMNVYRMELVTHVEEYNICESLKIRCIQDSIWRHEGELDMLYISFYPKHEDSCDFFVKGNIKARYYKQMEFAQMLEDAHEKGYSHIGFTPHYWYQYDKNYQKMLEKFCMERHPEMTIDFYYMNSWFKCRHIEKAVKTLCRSAKSLRHLSRRDGQPARRQRHHG